jgi:hypothetical protein
VVITNGDNLYDAHFIEELQRTPDSHDVVALDFYSRYQRPTGASRLSSSVEWL